MVGLFSSLELAKKSLLTHQFVFHVIGHNIANVNTPGYSRQRVELGVVRPFQVGFHFVGVGVDIIRIHAIRDDFLERQLQQEIEARGFANSLTGNFRVIEAIFNESTDAGISTALSNFFNAWNDLANNPTGLPERSTVLNNTKILADKIRETYRRLEEQRRVINNDIGVLVEEINEIGREIAQINYELSSKEGVNTPEINDLRDRRNVLLQKLGEKVAINVYENERHQVTVEIGGRPFVIGNDYNQVELVENPSNKNFYDVYMNESGNMVDITDTIDGGALRAMLDVRDTYIPEYMTRLDNLAYGLITNVNAIHVTGFDLNGNPALPLFTPYTPPAPGDYEGAAAHIELNPALVNNPEGLATSATGAVGDNQIALQIAELERSYNVVDSDNDGTFDYGTFADYYHQLTTLVGAHASNAYTLEESEEGIIEYLENRRDEVSAVSLDEESATLLQFEKAYQVMARFMGTINKLTDIMVNLGR